MLVRRIATVTISAPEASMAARVSEKSLYFPVPTKRRERNTRPAMTNGSSCVKVRLSLGAFIWLAATDGSDDLDFVAGPNRCRSVAALGYDLAIPLDSDALALKRELANQVGDGRLINGELAKYAVQCYR